MSSLKTITACLRIVTATAFGLTSTSPQDDRGQDAKSRLRTVPSLRSEPHRQSSYRGPTTLSSHLI